METVTSDAEASLKSKMLAEILMGGIMERKEVHTVEISKINDRCASDCIYVPAA